MTVLEVEYLQAQQDLVVFYDHPGQLTPGPLSHQTASPSSPAQCAGRPPPVQRICQANAYTSQSTGCTYVGTDTRQDIVRHAYTLVSQGHARTAAQARIQTSCARAVAAASTRHLSIGHQPVRQQNNTKGSRTPAQRAQMGSPPAADTRTNVTKRNRNNLFAHSYLV
jgi:hypothetical protein